MDQELIGRMLRGVHGRESGSTENESSGTMGEILAPLATIELDIIPFQSYRNRQGYRVAIRGSVDPDTKEYENGYRFYGEGGIMYFGNGQTGEGIQSQLDLVERYSFIPGEERNPLSSDQTWIHPSERNQTAFFRAVTSQTIRMEVGISYLNRMGLVIELQLSEISPETGFPIFRDQFGGVYDGRGQIFDNAMSMFDLVYEITRVRFLSGQGSGIQNQLTKAEDLEPENYDPFTESRAERRVGFFRKLAEISTLAKELDIGFSYYMFEI